MQGARGKINPIGNGDDPTPRCQEALTQFIRRSLRGHDHPVGQQRGSRHRRSQSAVGGGSPVRGGACIRKTALGNWLWSSSGHRLPTAGPSVTSAGGVRIMPERQICCTSRNNLAALWTSANSLRLFSETTGQAISRACRGSRHIAAAAKVEGPPGAAKVMRFIEQRSRAYKRLAVVRSAPPNT